MNDFLTEIKDDLKRERFDRVLHNHGKTIIAMSLVVVLGVGAGSWYKQDKQATAETNGNEYRFLIKDQNDEQKAQLDTFIAEKSGGYKMLAMFTKAKNLFGNAKLDDAVAAYDDIANNSSIDEHLRKLASYHAGMIELNQKKTDAVAARIETLEKGDQTWNASVTELKASLALETGNTEEALTLFTELANSPSAPNSIKERAAKAVSVLNANKGE